MPYSVILSKKAQEHAAALARSEPSAFNKLRKMLKELEEHPTIGTGHPHLLVGDKRGLWARSITKKHRLVYQVVEDKIMVIVLSACKHYDDK